MNPETVLVQLLGQALSSPTFWDFITLSGCHNAYDVAQDALEAAEAGHISREQALQICQILLGNSSPPAAPPRRQPVRPTQPAIANHDLAALVGQFEKMLR